MKHTPNTQINIRLIRENDMITAKQYAERFGHNATATARRLRVNNVPFIRYSNEKYYKLKDMHPESIFRAYTNKQKLIAFFMLDNPNLSDHELSCIFDERITRPEVIILKSKINGVQSKRN